MDTNQRNDSLHTSHGLKTVLFQLTIWNMIGMQLRSANGIY